MLSFFKTNNPAVVLLYVPYMVLLRLFFWKSQTPFSVPELPAEPLSRALLGWLGHSSALLILCGAVVQFIQALLVNGLVNQNKMTARKTYLPGAIYLLLASMLAENLLLSAPMLGLAFVLGAVSNVFQLAKKEKMNGALYDAGFLMGMAALFHLPYLVLFVFLYLSLGSVRAIVVREWIVALLGFATPVFLVFTVYFVADWPAPAFYSTGIFSLGAISTVQKIGLGVIAFFSVMALAGMQGALYSAVIQVRKFTTILLSLYVFVIVGFFLQERVTMAHLMGLLVPIAIVGSMVLMLLKRWYIAEVLHIILLLLVLALQWLPLFNII